MIELTQKSLNVLLTRFGIDIRTMIMVKAQLTDNSTVGKLDTVAYNAFQDIIVFPVEALYYASEEEVGSITPSATKSHSLSVVGDLIKITNITAGEYYVIFALTYQGSGNAINCGDLLQYTNLTTVDYVGNLIGGLKFSGLYSALKEINLSNNSNLGNGVFNNINLNFGQILNYGNFNNVEFSPGAFAGTPIKKFVFPKSETDYDIPSNCLSGCNELEEVYIPDTCVTTIGAGAFNGCSNLKYIYIGSGITDIEDDAFSGCSNPSLVFDVSLNNPNFLGERGCLLRKNNDTAHTYNIIHATSTWFSASSDGGLVNCHVVPATDFSSPMTTRHGYLTTLLSGHGETAVDVHGNTINNLVRITPNNYASAVAHYPTTVAGFYIPVFTLIKEIEENACAGDPLITTLDFHNNFTYPWINLNKINNNAFDGCTALTTVNIPDITDYIATNITLGEKVFSNCTLLNTVTINRQVEIGTKAFYNSGLVTINFKYNPSFPSTSYQWFSNTPNLANITCSNISNTGDYVVAYHVASQFFQRALNAIIRTSDNSLKVGCKTTDFAGIASVYNCTKIGSYAFYGCTDLTITSLPTSYVTIADYSFYNCISLSITDTLLDSGFLTNVQTIGEAAFYGCTGIKKFYSSALVDMEAQAFANSGVVSINLPSTVVNIMPSAFEGCLLGTVVAAASNFAIQSTADGINSIVRHGGEVPICLIQGGNHSTIITNSDSTNHPSQIYPNAFAGVDFGTAGDMYGDLVIPSTVLTVGSHILANSKRNGSATPTTGYDTLALYPRLHPENQVIKISGNENALLFLLGAKYFKKMVDDTVQYRNSNQTYYYINYTPGAHTITLYEQRPGHTTEVLKIQYSATSQQIELVISNVPDYDYASGGSGSHIHPFSQTHVLMSNKAIITQEMQNIYFNTNPGYGERLCPGDRCCGYPIPDVQYSNSTTEEPIYIDDGYKRDYIYTYNITEPFADCQWVTHLTTYKNLTNYDGSMEGAFKNCTNLQTVNFIKYGSEFAINFGGKVSKSMFEGCSNLVEIGGIIDTDILYPLIYDTNCFKDCNRVRQGEINWYQYNGTTFNDGSFENTRLPNTTTYDINLISATHIDPQAFKSNNYTSAKADSTCGYYFTGCGQCIVDTNNKIVVGSQTFDLSNCKGIGSYAFYKLTKSSPYPITINDKTGFTIGSYAFTASNISSYSETGTTNGTLIDIAAFSQCPQLTSVTLKNGCTLNDGAFSECPSLSTLSIANGIAIPNQCFVSCTSLTNVTITSDVGTNAFSDCVNLTQLTLNYTSSSQAVIDSSAFNGCPLSTLIISGASATGNYRFITKAIYDYSDDGYHYLELLLGTNTVTGTELVRNNWNNPLKIIGAHAFDGRGLVGEFIVPASVVKIDDYAFANNPLLTYVSIPTTVEYIGAHAFDGCTNLESFTIPDSCVYLGAGALQGCSLEKGVNCNTVDKRYFYPTNLGHGELSGVTSFDGSLNLSNNTYFKSIATNAFKGSSIRNIVFPSNINTIEETAFKDCTHLVEIRFYGSVSIESEAFYGCMNLCDIYLYDSQNVPIIVNNSFYGAGSAQTKKYIHIKAGTSSYVLGTNFYNKLHNDCGFTLVEDL